MPDDTLVKSLKIEIPEQKKKITIFLTKGGPGSGGAREGAGRPLGSGSGSGKEPWQMTQKEWSDTSLPKPSSDENIILYHRLDKPEHLDSVLKEGLLLSKKVPGGEGGSSTFWFADSPTGYSEYGTIIGVEVPKVEANLGWSGQGQARVMRDIKPGEIVFVDKEGFSSASGKQRVHSEREYDTENQEFRYHEQYVKDALVAGKKVPTDVLKDYPKLQKKEESVKLVIKSEEKRIVYGEVYAPLHVDTDKEAMTADEIEKMAHRFLSSNFSDKIDVNHNLQVSGCVIVESFIARKNDPDGFIEGAWILGVKVIPDEIWAEVKNGNLNGFSFYGKVGKRDMKAKVMMTKRLTGETELSTSEEIEPHIHKVDVSFDEEGKIIECHTDTNLGHKHCISNATATKAELGHSHRLILIGEKTEDLVFKGGSGSGNFGHEGRPGYLGGSLPGLGDYEVGTTVTADDISYEKTGRVFGELSYYQGKTNAVIRDNGEVVSIASYDEHPNLYPDGKEYIYLGQIDSRMKGAGSAALYEVAKYAVSKNSGLALKSVRDAVPFYNKCGFGLRTDSYESTVSKGKLSAFITRYESAKGKSETDKQFLRELIELEPKDGIFCIDEKSKKGGPGSGGAREGAGRPLGSGSGEVEVDHIVSNAQLRADAKTLATAVNKGEWGDPYGGKPDDIRAGIANAAADEILRGEMEGIIHKSGDIPVAIASYKVYNEAQWKTVDVSFLATKVKGNGERMMQHIAKIAAKDNLGVNLTALKSAVTFYEHIGMKNSWRGKESFYFTPAMAKEYADKGRIAKGDAAQFEPKNGAFCVPEMRLSEFEPE